MFQLDLTLQVAGYCFAITVLSLAELFPELLSSLLITIACLLIGAQVPEDSCIRVPLQCCYEAGVADESTYLSLASYTSIFGVSSILIGSHCSIS